MIPAKITPKHLKRTAYVYVRQSTLRTGPGEPGEPAPASTSWRTGPAPWAGAGWRWWTRTWDAPGSGRVVRPGFQRLLSAVCLEEVGGVFALEVLASGPQQQGLVPPGRPVRTDLDASSSTPRGSTIPTTSTTVCSWASRAP